MGLDRSIDITAEERKTVLILLARYLPNTTAWVYGSRVKWTARPESDLDVVVFATPEQAGRVSELREAFEESNLPFRVDLFVWDEVSEQFCKQIQAEHVVLVEREERGVEGSWRTTPFARLFAEPVRNGIYKKKEFHGRGKKIVNMGELFAHPRLTAVPMKRVELSESEIDRFHITAGDLLFARRSLVAEGAGKCCVVLDVDEPTTFESSIIRVRLDSAKADCLYFYYFFGSALGLHHLDTIRRQVAVAGITGSDLAQLEIPVPPPSEQRAIAHILGTLDDKIDLNRRMNQTLEEMARALFKSWFVDFDPVRAKMEGRDSGLPKDIASLFPERLMDSVLGEIPEGWRHETLPILANVVYGAPFGSSQFRTDGQGIPLIRIRDLGSQAPGISTKEQHRNGHLIVPGDIVVGMDGEFRLHIWKGPASWLNQRVCHFEPKPGVPICYLSEALKKPLALFENTKAGTTVIHLGKADIDSVLLLNPGARVLAAFGNVCTAILELQVTKALEARALAALRETLLPRLVSGELRVRDVEEFIESTV